MKAFSILLRSLDGRRFATRLELLDGSTGNARRFLASNQPHSAGGCGSDKESSASTSDALDGKKRLFWTPIDYKNSQRIKVAICDSFFL